MYYETAVAHVNLAQNPLRIVEARPALKLASIALAALAFIPFTACKPAAKQIVPANSIIPDPVPTAHLSDWTALTNRIPVSLDLNGTVLRGWTFQSVAGHTTRIRILFFNGNAMTIDSSQPFYRELTAQGADVTVFDYRGYGFSGGRADVMKSREDSLALYDQLAANGPVVVYGFSMGTAMAAYIASQRRTAGLILAGTIASAAEEFPIFARAQGFSARESANMVPSPEAVAAFDEVGLVARSPAPLLMLHGEADTLVPIHQGREVYTASSAQQKQFVSLPGKTHNETVDALVALQAVREFIRTT